ncbi:MAG: hypothetical protein BWK73_26820 [Thiothrix lacustris]|uniref:FtsK alpha domain-containing protein n=1 Tax=Thiothrix lacustris TaxID=525917 RepID=A0A1Y1QKJ8_9GAMM|nr:MAG: hypothetical protein BWK73_26820 [Thiothrix lacustris]
MIERDYAMRTAIQIIRVMIRWGVHLSLAKAQQGPRLLILDFNEAPGTRAAQITDRSKDLARKLGGVNLRIDTNHCGKIRFEIA